jgi:hypothetical protein
MVYIRKEIKLSPTCNVSLLSLCGAHLNCATFLHTTAAINHLMALFSDPKARGPELRAACDSDFLGIDVFTNG